MPEDVWCTRGVKLAGSEFEGRDLELQTVDPTTVADADNTPLPGEDNNTSSDTDLGLNVAKIISVPEVVVTSPVQSEPDQQSGIHHVTPLDGVICMGENNWDGNSHSASEDHSSEACGDGLGEPEEYCECLAVLRSQPSEQRMVLNVSRDGTSFEKALVDTGANVSLLHNDLVDKWAIELSPSTCSSIAGFGVGNVVPVRGCCTLSLTVLGVKMKPAEFLVIDAAEMRNISVLLATDFLATNRLNIDVSARTITHTREDGAILEHHCGGGAQACFTTLHGIPCYAVATVVIPSNHAEEIPVRWNSPECMSGGHAVYSVFCFEESDKWQSFEIPSGLVSAEAGQSTLVATNGTSEWCKIKSGDFLGTLSTVFPVEWPTDGVEVSVSAVTDRVADTPGIELDPDLSDSERDIVLRLLKDEEAVFSRGDDDIGTLTGSTHRIVLYDYSPIYQRPRRFPEVVNAEVEKQCQELYEADVIEPSNSPWSSPVVPVRKKDGSLRLCIDYRRLNAVTVPDKFPLPNLSDAVFGLHGMRYFTSLDLVRGYYQFSLDEASREFTAFSTHRAHWQFKCLTFGLKNAPSVFQREMQNILKDFKWRSVIVYIDDVLILSETFAEHVDLVRRVLGKLVEHGAKIKGPKCKWFCKQVEFLGHIVSHDGLSKPQSYVDAVTSFPRPTTVRELREFIGLINFQRKFIPQCSVIMKPLSKLTGQTRTTKIKWTDEMISAFEKLREEVKQDIILAFPDYSEGAPPLELYTDASGTGVGACLVQRQGDSLRHIAYASLAFSSAEKNYSTLDRELAAIRWAVRTFRGFLSGVDFVIRTDHRPLEYLHNMQIVNSRLARTIEDLADYSFIIKYAPGKLNTAADILSRRNWAAESDGGSISAVACLPAGLVLLECVPGGGDYDFKSVSRQQAS